MDYLARPYCWMPDSLYSSTRRLAGLLLPTQQPVNDIDLYLSQLSDKVIWFIQNEESLAEAHEMICGFLNYGLFASLPQPEFEAGMEQWARDLTLNNGPLRDYFETQAYLRFPLSPRITTSEETGPLEEPILEEWLSSMSVHVHE